MNKICTDIEQSKKLIELGININTADLTVTDFPIQNGDRFKFINNKLPGDIFPSITDGKSEKIPAWSLSALLNILPDSIYDNTDEYSQLEFTKRSVAYHDMNDGIKVGSIKENLVDAAYEVILKLHKLNLL